MQKSKKSFKKVLTIKIKRYNICCRKALKNNRNLMQKKKGGNEMTYDNLKIDKELAELIRIRIKNLMNIKKCSNEDVANYAKMNIVTFNRKMNGKSNWKLSECILIAIFFNTTVESIFLPKKLQKSIKK